MTTTASCGIGASVALVDHQRIQLYFGRLNTANTHD
jgi:hypothetical protein